MPSRKILYLHLDYSSSSQSLLCTGTQSHGSLHSVECGIEYWHIGDSTQWLFAKLDWKVNNLPLTLKTCCVSTEKHAVDVGLHCRGEGLVDDKRSMLHWWRGTEPVVGPPSLDTFKKGWAHALGELSNKDHPVSESPTEAQGMPGIWEPQEILGELNCVTAQR